MIYNNMMLIRYALSILNFTNNGYKMFEELCKELVPLVLDLTFLPSSGPDTGGDSGIDGWGYLYSEKTKYAFSINQDFLRKIETELPDEKSCYKNIVYLTNQVVKEKNKKKVLSENPNLNITIYDGENIAIFIKNQPKLGFYINLPRLSSIITLDYLSKHNQLRASKEKIEKYIPRQIKITGTQNQQEKEISLVQYCERSEFKKFTILQAPAGYGKTCALQQLHQLILSGKTEVFLPPVYISLSDYFPGSLVSKIEDGLSKNGDYTVGPYLLLLDGYDEVKNENKSVLVKEIAQLVLHVYNIRKVIISVRDNTYNKNDFGIFKKDIEIIDLIPLIPDDIKMLLKVNNLLDDVDIFLSNPYFKNLIGNIFYVTGFIEYYKENKTIADNQKKLFDFIVKQEIKQNFRGNVSDIKKYQALAFYMNQHQIVECSDSSIINAFDILQPIPFKFSHKDIQEYFAARFIASQTEENIWQMVTNGNLILPYLTNTFGFVLNILNCDNKTYDLFEKLVERSLKEEGNAIKLLQIEGDKISLEMNNVIFQKIIEQEGLSGDYSGNLDQIITFIFSEQAYKENVKYLVNYICQNTTYNGSFILCTNLLESIVNSSYKDFLNEDLQQKLFDSVLYMLRSSNKNKEDFVDLLMYSVKSFPIINKQKTDDIRFIINKLLPKMEDYNSLFNNCCELLLNSKVDIELPTYYNFIKIFIKLSNQGFAGYIVPNRIDENNFFPSNSVKLVYSFIPLTQSWLNSNFSLVWKIMEFIGLENLNSITHQDSHEQKELNVIFFDSMLKDISKNGYSLAKERILVTYMLYNESICYSQKNWEDLERILMPKTFDETVFMMLQQKKYYLLYKSALKEHYYKVLSKVVRFEVFKSIFYSKGRNSEYFFYYFCEGLSLNPLIKKLIPADTKENIDCNKKKQEFIEINKDREKNLNKSYKIVFNEKLLKIKITEIFDFLDEITLSEEGYPEYVIKEKYPSYDSFALYMIVQNRIKSKLEILEILDNKNWNHYKIPSLLEYMVENKIQFDKLEESEKAECLVWAKTFLNQYPLGPKSKFVYGYRWVEILAKDTDILLKDKNFVKNYASQLKSLILIPLELSFNNDILYLKNYLSEQDIVSYILEQFDLVKDDIFILDRSLKFVVQYEKLIPIYQKNGFKKILKNYIIDNISSNYNNKVIDCFLILGGKISDIPSKLMIETLEIDEKIGDLKNNFASGLLNFYNLKKVKENNPKDFEFMLNVIEEAFNHSQNQELKAILAEYYICNNKEAGEIFSYYASYICIEGNQMSNVFTHGGLSTSDIFHLVIIQNLLLHALKDMKQSEKRSGLILIALESYREIVSCIKKEEEFDLVVGSIKSVKEYWNKTDGFIREITIAYRTRMYVPYSIEKILKLKMQD